jgi:hypothetical protein
MPVNIGTTTLFPETGNETLPAKITLTLAQTSLHLVVDGEIELD